MRSRLLLVVLALAAPAAAACPVAFASVTGGARGVPIFTAAFGSPRIDVVAGDTVTWHNDSVRIHTVAAADGSWASSPLSVGATFSRRFGTPGVVNYYCQMHPFMRAEVDVHRLLLSAPRDAAAPGRPYVLGGRTALAAGSTVSILADGGTPAGTGRVDAGGVFRVTVRPRTTTTYRAAADGDTSPPVQLRVLDRRVVAAARAGARRAVVTARVLPASRGATVVLQMYLRERFGWWPVQRARLDRRSHARFIVRPGRRVRARVVLTLSDGATPLARSRTFIIGHRGR